MAKFKSNDFNSISSILESQNKPKDFVKACGHVSKILNENFGIIDMGRGEFALFDTFDVSTLLCNIPFCEGNSSAANVAY